MSKPDDANEEKGGFGTVIAALVGTVAAPFIMFFLYAKGLSFLLILLLGIMMLIFFA